jgi:hypothetical protein
MFVEGELIILSKRLINSRRIPFLESKILENFRLKKMIELNLVLLLKEEKNIFIPC